jgi:hypothetical protein
VTRLSFRPDLLSPSRDSSGGYPCVANSVLNEGDVFGEGFGIRDGGESREESIRKLVSQFAAILKRVAVP